MRLSYFVGSGFNQILSAMDGDGRIAASNVAIRRPLKMPLRRSKPGQRRAGKKGPGAEKCKILRPWGVSFPLSQ
jgi:hypothetical protein